MRRKNAARGYGRKLLDETVAELHNRGIQNVTGKYVLQRTGHYALRRRAVYVGRSTAEFLRKTCGGRGHLLAARYEMIDVCLLGTGGMMPLPYRWLTSLLVRYNGHTILVDCGEGTGCNAREGMGQIPWM